MVITFWGVLAGVIINVLGDSLLQNDYVFRESKTEINYVLWDRERQGVRKGDIC